jgi:hypothetical protein
LASPSHPRFCRVWRFSSCDVKLIGMDSKRLADPAFEPTDEDLIGLSKRAFAHVRDAREESLRRLRAEIAVAHHAALERLRAKWPGLTAAG